MSVTPPRSPPRTVGTSRGPGADLTEPARRPDPAPAGDRGVDARAAVHAALPGVHARAGAGQLRHELHRHAAGRHPFAVRGAVRRAGQLRQADRGPALPQGHPQHLPLPVAGRPVDDGHRARRRRAPQPDHPAQRLLPGRLLPAGRHQHRGRLGGVEVPVPRQRRPVQHRAGLGRASTGRPGSTAPRWLSRRWW